MPLITCPECGRLVSDRAAACPCCGWPLDQPVLIEHTSKRWKLLQLLGALGVGLGLLAFWLGIASDAKPITLVSIAVTFAGLAAYLTGRIGGWWCHG